MKSKRSNTISFLAGAATMAAMAALPACQGVNTVNDPVFVEAADQFVNQTVGPEYEGILKGTIDPGTLTQPEIDDRIQNVRTFRAAVQSAKDEIDETQPQD